MIAGSGEHDKELSLMEHLLELRNRLMVAVVAVALTTAVSFLFSVDIIKILLLPSGFERLLTISPTENFATVMRVALFSGIALSMPVLLYEVYAYISPALLRNERRFILTLGPFVLVLFAGGMAFCYFLLLPQAIKFLVGFGGDVFDNQLRATEYLEFVTTFILGIGVVFEMPAVIFGLVKVRVLKREWLASKRRLIFLLVFVVGAVITPTPDPFNQALVAIPMYLLFELGLLLARFA